MKTVRLILICVTLLTIGFVAGRTRSVPKPPALAPDPLTDAVSLTGVRRSFAFKSVPLDRVIDELASLYNAPLSADWEALERAGIRRDQRIDYSRRDKELADALRYLPATNKDMPVGYKLVEGKIIVTSADDANRHSITRVYDMELLIVSHRIASGEALRDMLGTPPILCVTGIMLPAIDTEPEVTDAEVAGSIMNVLRESIAVGSWFEDGGNVGMMRLIGNTLIVTQAPDVHRQIAATLNAIHEGDLARIRNRQALIERLQAMNRPH